MTTERELREWEWRKQSRSTWYKIKLQRGNHWQKLLLSLIFCLSFVLAWNEHYDIPNYKPLLNQENPKARAIF